MHTVGGGGHWTVHKEVSGRYYDGNRNRLMRDRLCAPCAAGGRGSACLRCQNNTVRLYSGDVVAFSGSKAFHGVARVVREPSPPTGPPDAPTLPAWARKYLNDGYRLSVQWRLTDSVKLKAKAERDAERGLEMRQRH